MISKRYRGNIIEENIKDTWFIYVVLCSDNTLYCGISNDVEKRIKKHNTKSGAKYTKTRTPVVLVYRKEYGNKSLALKAEYAFKALTRKEKENIIWPKGEFTQHIKQI